MSLIRDFLEEEALMEFLLVQFQKIIHIDLGGLSVIIC